MRKSYTYPHYPIVHKQKFCFFICVVLPRSCATQSGQYSQGLRSGSSHMELWEIQSLRETLAMREIEAVNERAHKTPCKRKREKQIFGFLSERKLSCCWGLEQCTPLYLCVCIQTPVTAWEPECGTELLNTGELECWVLMCPESRVRGKADRHALKTRLTVLPGLVSHYCVWLLPLLTDQERGLISIRSLNYCMQNHKRTVINCTTVQTGPHNLAG